MRSRGDRRSLSLPYVLVRVPVQYGGGRDVNKTIANQSKQKRGTKSPLVLKNLNYDIRGACSCEGM